MASRGKRGRGPTEADRAFMREALRIAGRARGRTAPNPMVGALVVRAGERVASGHHRVVGAAHAEAVALARAGARARGATLYVTLEPCAHSGRTPPCLEAVLAARPRRVVVGTLDSDPRTSGRSVSRLRRAGIDVTVGVETDACLELNRGYFSRVERSRPYTTLKLAASLDGRIATASGESRWISGPPARALVHRLRASVDAIAIGSGTALADDPALTARRSGRIVHRPRRIVIDSRLRVPPSARLLQGDASDAWLVATRRAPGSREKRLLARGARVLRVAERDGRVDVRSAWRSLAANGVNDLLVEGGGELAASLLKAQLVDRLCLVLSPRLIGGDGRPVLAALGVKTLAAAPTLVDYRVRRVGPDLWIDARF